MRSKRIAIFISASLILLGLISFIFRSEIYDHWLVYRLKNEDGFLKDALLKPELCTPDAINIFLKSKKGKEALFELVLPYGEKWCSFCSDYKKGNFEQAFFFMHEEAATYLVLKKKGTEFSSGKIRDDVLFQKLVLKMTYLENFSITKKDQQKKYTLVPGGKAPKLAGIYLSIVQGMSFVRDIRDPHQAKNPPPKSFTAEDQKNMDEGFLLIIDNIENPKK